MKRFSNETLARLCAEGKKYYVYRLVDPRTLQTFYVGKGCGNRVFDHAEAAKHLVDKDNDEISLKFQQILDIIAAGKDVMCIIHRWNLTERQAYAVEAALIDCYPGLTNAQNGHDSQFGLISAEDLEKSCAVAEYIEPTSLYVIVKTTPAVIAAKGSLYEATKNAWVASLKSVRRYKYVLSVVYGIVREVYEVDNWYVCSPDRRRIGFDGKPTSDAEMLALKGKRIPKIYSRKGLANPFQYKKK